MLTIAKLKGGAGLGQYYARDDYYGSGASEIENDLEMAAVEAGADYWSQGEGDGPHGTAGRAGGPSGGLDAVGTARGGSLEVEGPSGTEDAAPGAPAMAREKGL